MTNRALITKVQIKADAQGNAPSQIELLRTGKWQTPWHGDFEITTADLHEFAANFAKGIGLVAGDKKAPINYAHESWEKAAAWMPRLNVSEDGQALLADGIEWTPAAVQALKDGEWKYISPEFNPRGCPWEDPEGTDDPDGIPEFVNNVLSGAALTNIPLFKKLKPIMASRVPTKKKASSEPGDGEKHNQGEPMKLEDIRAKQVSDLTDEEKTFLSEHKTELTDDERTTFGLVDDDQAAKDAADKEAADKAAAEAKAKEESDQKAADEKAKLEASNGKGVQISADRLAKLEADAQAGREAREELARKEAEEIVGRSVHAGQIKSGDKDSWVKQLLASKGESRTQLETLLEGLPKNEDLGKEIGDQGKQASTNASDEVHTRVLKIQADARDAGKSVSYASARKQVLNADKELKAQFEEEEK